MSIIVGVKRWVRWATFLAVMAAFLGAVLGKVLTAPRPVEPPKPCVPALVLMSNVHDTVTCASARTRVIQVWETTAQGVLVLMACDCDNGSQDAGIQ